MACRAVCISRALGAGGEEVGRLVADRLGFVYVDEEIVSRTAARAGIDAASVADEEQRRSIVSRMLQALAQSGTEALAVGGGPAPHPDDEPTGEAVRALIRETIEQTASQGNVVIVAHAASYALPPGPDALRVLVTASPATRAKRLADSEGLDEDGGARAVKESDASRRDYLKRFYGVDEAPTHYDLVVNTDVLSFDHAADLVAGAASRQAS
jgi:cytidylate kinase